MKGDLAYDDFLYKYLKMAHKKHLAMLDSHIDACSTQPRSIPKEEAVPTMEQSETNLTLSEGPHAGI